MWEHHSWIINRFNKTISLWGLTPNGLLDFRRLFVWITVPYSHKVLNVLHDTQGWTKILLSCDFLLNSKLVCWIAQTYAVKRIKARFVLLRTVYQYWLWIDCMQTTKPFKLLAQHKQHITHKDKRMALLTFLAPFTS